MAYKLISIACKSLIYHGMGKIITFAPPGIFETHPSLIFHFFKTLL